MICPECGANTSLNRDDGPQAHEPWCPRRGSHVTGLTMQNIGMPEKETPGWVAQCDDGHPFWEGERRTGDWALQQALAEIDMWHHDHDVHSEKAALAAAYDQGWHAPVYENSWAPVVEVEPGEPEAGARAVVLAPVVDLKREANAKRAREEGVEGVFLSRLWLDGQLRSEIQPVVRVGEEDGGWWFYLPDTWPAEDWRGDIRWFNQDGALFLSGMDVFDAQALHPFGSAVKVEEPVEESDEP